MVRLLSSNEIKRLVLKFVLENAECRKRSLYLQEIIRMGKKDELWTRALAAYFDSPVHSQSFIPPGKN